MMGLDDERRTLVDIVSTLCRVSADSLSDDDMVTLLDMIAEAIK